MLLSFATNLTAKYPLTILNSGMSKMLPDKSPLISPHDLSFASLLVVSLQYD